MENDQPTSDELYIANTGDSRSIIWKFTEILPSDSIENYSFSKDVKLYVI